MIPKSLVLSYLALQIPGLAPTTSPNTVDSVAIVPVAALEPLLGGQTERGGLSVWDDGNKVVTVDFSTFRPGPWDDSTDVNNAFEVSASPDQTYLYTHKKDLPNIPTTPDDLDHLLGGATGNNQIHLKFHHPHHGISVELLYTFNGRPARTPLILSYRNGKEVKEISGNLGDKWAKFDMEDSFKSLVITTEDAQPGGKLLLSKVSYIELKK